MMFSKRFLVAAPLALIAGLAFASPAAAQRWEGPRELRNEIAQLDRHIEQNSDSRRYTNQELRQLRNSVENLEDRYDRYSRNGWTRSEVNDLGDRIENARERVRYERRDDDRRDRRYRY